jgi:alkanesulfonate monooxygenase SsuD/methylene tetrahydromethanopterin reductase-like flavin-dependent oxidoreductase (luciferase family)
MTRPFRFNAFAMHALTHQSPGLWRHARDRSREFARLPLWLELARLWERGLFDGVFLADVLGPYDVFGGDARAAIRSGAGAGARSDAAGVGDGFGHHPSRLRRYRLAQL